MSKLSSIWCRNNQLSSVWCRNNQLSSICSGTGSSRVWRARRWQCEASCAANASGTAQQSNPNGVLINYHVTALLFGCISCNKHNGCWERCFGWVLMHTGAQNCSEMEHLWQLSNCCHVPVSWLSYPCQIAVMFLSVCCRIPVKLLSGSCQIAVMFLSNCCQAPVKTAVEMLQGSREAWAHLKLLCIDTILYCAINLPTHKLSAKWLNEVIPI